MSTSPSPESPAASPSQDPARAVVAAKWLRGALAATLALSLLELGWELWLAPLKPGGSWLALKAVPLAALWRRAARGEVWARQVLAFVLLPYVAEGVVRALTEHGRHALVAAVAALLAGTAFAALLAHFRALRRR